VEPELTEEQAFFVETTRRFLQAECSISAVRDLEDDPAGYDPKVWAQGAQLGWTSLLVPEADGGGSFSEDGLLDLVLVAEEMGRVVAPGPLGPVNVVASVLARVGSPEQKADVLPGLLTGERVAAWCGARPVSGRPEGAPSCSRAPARQSRPGPRPTTCWPLSSTPAPSARSWCRPAPPA
jgi:alkylation response protein AidB-like acyl-CoA dehydrogenase